MKVLMICLGNICRSPLAEGILQSKTKLAGLAWEVDSAGTSSYHSGERPDSRSIKVAAKYGLDLNSQRSRQINTNDLDSFDLILVMDSSNYQDVMRLCRNNSQRQKVKLIMNYLEPDKNIQVPDPYYGDNGFEQVYEMLDRACGALIQKETA